MRKLIRTLFASTLKPEEIEQVENKAELNKLYKLKILEELNEISMSEFKDTKEYADLLETIEGMMRVNDVKEQDVLFEKKKKQLERGYIHKTVLKKLNPANASNVVYVNGGPFIEKKMVKYTVIVGNMNQTFPFKDGKAVYEVYINGGLTYIPANLGSFQSGHFQFLAVSNEQVHFSVEKPFFIKAIHTSEEKAFTLGEQCLETQEKSSQ